MNQPNPGVGMPQALLLNEFANQVWHAFGCPPYLVGSALYGKQWRDVDVRLILADHEYEKQGFGDPARPHQNGKWVAMVQAFSALGKSLTGLPIDFQIQQQTLANAQYQGSRSSLGHVNLRVIDDEVDGPTYDAGRQEGHADILAEIRHIIDPDDLNHYNRDGVRNAIQRLVANESRQ